MAQPTIAAADDRAVVPDFGLDHGQPFGLDNPVVGPFVDNEFPINNGLQPIDQAQDVDVANDPFANPWGLPDHALFDYLTALPGPEPVVPLAQLPELPAQDPAADVDQVDAEDFGPLTEYHIDFNSPEFDAFFGVPGTQLTGGEASTPASSTRPTTPTVVNGQQHVHRPQFWQTQVPQKFRPNAAIDDWILKLGTGVPEE